MIPLTHSAKIDRVDSNIKDMVVLHVQEENYWSTLTFKRGVANLPKLFKFRQKPKDQVYEKGQVKSK